MSVSLFSLGSHSRVSAAVGINRQINFQGKLVNLNGTNVTDGTYSIVYSIYSVASAGTAIWTETQSVSVANGVFQVNLGSVTALPGSVDFNTDNIYLGIKVGADAEMAPRVQFTSVPQAFNSEKLGGLDKTGFVQNGTVQQASSNFNISGTGVANLLQASTFDAASAVALNIGTSNASSLTVSKAGVTTTIAGALTVTQATTLNGTGTGLAVTNNATVGGTLAVTGLTTLTGGLANPGSTLNTSLALANFATGGAIGTAAATVDTKTTFTVNQTTAGQTLTLPSPTITTAGREIRISNIGTTSFVIGSSIINTGITASYFWNGTAWTSTGIDTGVTIIGSLNGGTANANAATISGNTIFLQSANGSFAGLVDTGAQIFGGNKQFNGVIQPNNDIQFSQGANRNLTVAANTTANTAGNSLTLAAGAANGSTTGAVGGALVFLGGAAAGTGNNNGGNVILDGGAATGTGTRGSILLQTTGGFVGIGTASAQTALTVQGTIGIDPSDSNAGLTGVGASNIGTGLQFGVSGSGEGIRSARAAAAPNQFGIDFITSGINRLSITNGGNVNIGNVLGSALLGVGSSSQFQVNTTGNVSTSGTLAVGNTTTITTTNAAAFKVQDAGSAATLTVSTSLNQVVVGNGANTITLSASTGYTATGTARKSKRIQLTAEYAGAVLDAGSGLNNTGSMTSGVNLTNRMNYYKWTTTQATNQNYDVVIQVPIPTDFDVFASTNPVRISTYSSDLTNGTISFELRDSTNAVIQNFVSVTPTAINTFQARDPGTVTGTYTAGDYLTVRIRMQSPTSGDIRIGNLYFDYLSKF